MATIWNDTNFDQEVLQSELPVVVDFYADWCGPCKMMSPVIEAISKEYDGRIKVGKINVDESPNTSAKYRVMSIPTLLFIKNGQVADQIIGAVPKRQLTEKIDQLI